MTKEQFDDLFVKTKMAASPASEEEIGARIAEYAEDPNRITLYEMMAYLQGESIRYTNDLVYTLFVNTFEFDASK